MSSWPRSLLVCNNLDLHTLRLINTNNRSSKKTLPQAVRAAIEDFAEKQVELWAFDEHRIGLIPLLRKVYAPRGQHPMVSVQTRYEWLYLYGFVQPQTGRTLWYSLPEVSSKVLNAVLEDAAKTLIGTNTFSW